MKAVRSALAAVLAIGALATEPQRKRIEAQSIDEATISRPALAEEHQDGFLGIANSRELEDDMLLMLIQSEGLLDN
jgi:hypothetical protein